MAEVRLRFAREAYKLLKPSYQLIFDKDFKSVSKVAYVVALTQNDRVTSEQRLCATSRPCLETPKLNVSEITGGLVTLNRFADGDAVCLNSLSKRIHGNVSLCIDCNGLHAITPVHLSSWRSSCLGTHGKLPLLCIHAASHHFKLQFRRSTHTKSLHERSHGHFGQLAFEFVSFTRAYSGRQSNGTQEEPLYRTKSAYYDILEVSPTATQTQIKTAYYKMSFIYHPDKNAGSEDATSRFAQISEAYNVLGNKALRKKYDRGILSQGDLQGSGRPTVKDSPASASGQQTRARHSPSVGADQQNIFDFDAFIRAHYGEQLQRDKELRQRRKEMLKKQEQNYEDVKLGRMKEITVAMLLVMAMAILFNLKSSK
ncbi:uncharacterized protein LOC127433451 isoform X2 [Myxocyprinus asiaticus]|uniref:uncharacterized protein LOC127433451 isoform X2 n=1 Tax=Myxocyprinus asiaticus TaxID=70543 RepID=UPI0022221FF7|nr:uncharacterized protein LOC127433451 isoform X2 [Myxocyprinus asiaticus]XP_051541335.1 uncharacterized protein LOC127433451 isoform X2 [Myxocyprinus asiaticus]